MSRSRPWVHGSARWSRAITNTTRFRVTCISFIVSDGGCAGYGGARYRGAASAAGSLWTGLTGLWTDGFQPLACSIPILCNALTPVIRGGSRMRRRARTDLCGGRSAMVVPTASAKKIEGKPRVYWLGRFFPGCRRPPSRLLYVAGFCHFLLESPYKSPYSRPARQGY